MPITIRCSKCGQIFYHSGRLFSIRKALEGITRCPSCDKVIVNDLSKIKIEIK